MSKLTEKQKRFADEKSLKIRLWALKEITKRYLDISELISDDLIEECKEIIYSESALPSQKEAAKIIMNLKLGPRLTNNIIEERAIVSNRNDGLVHRWRRKVKERDVNCQICGSDEMLEAHHISHWANDPINRININNGILLCSKCHRAQHPEMNEKLFGGAKHER